jgi:hypothetical protein
MSISGWIDGSISCRIERDGIPLALLCAAGDVCGRRCGGHDPCQLALGRAPGRSKKYLTLSQTLRAACGAPNVGIFT